MPSPPARWACAGSRTSSTPPQAGALGRATVELENAGSATWRELLAAYHWLDDLGNAIVWDGLRTPVRPLAPGERTELALAVRAPIPPSPYRLAFDLVLEHRYWLSEIGNSMLRDRRRRRPARREQPGRAPAAGRRAVAGLARARARRARGGLRRGRGRDRRRPRPRASRLPAGGGGRNPSFAEPLVCPSLLLPLAPNCTVSGLPAWRPEGGEPWIYDARIVAQARPGAGPVAVAGAAGPCASAGEAGSELDRDPVVDPAEDPRAEGERDERRATQR